MKKKLQLYAVLLFVGIMGALSSGVVRAADTDIVIEATATEANQTLTVTKYFANDYMVDRGDGSPVETVSAYKTHTYSTASGYTITLSLTGGADRWTFDDATRPLISGGTTTVTGVKIVSMPSLADGFGESATNPGDYFFKYFNYGGKLTSLPAGSFDTSNITTVGDDFFAGFNFMGGLTSLPEGSFDTSNITTVGNYFFNSFNNNGALTSLPEGSFDTSNITTVGNYFFNSFNYNGKLTSLPERSFDTSNITTVGDYFFNSFNYNGKLTSLPERSFDTSNITTVGNYFFNSFNCNGALESLPERSFDTSNITTVGDSFFYSFNYNGKLTSLPEGSFDTSNITTAGRMFFAYFNCNGALESLPSSFTLNSIGVSVHDGYRSAFTSPNYTLNRNVSDLVAGITPPTSDMDTFSDNQPGRCGVHANWLVNPATCYTITFDSNGGSTVDPQIVEENGTGTKPSDPARGGYTFGGRYEDINFGGMEFDFENTAIIGDIILYAKWTQIPSVGGGGSGKPKPVIDDCPDGDYSDSYYDGICGKKDSSSNDDKVSSGANAKDIIDFSATPQNDGERELQTAYERAYENGITTMDTVEKADLNGNLTRIAMAKMLSKYAVNVLGKKPDETKINQFKDVSKELDAQYDNGVTLAYQLGIMGINMPNNNFRPFDLVSRAEFVTALSRMKYGTPDGEYAGTAEYYKNHMEILSNEGIVSLLDPEMKELRGYVMVMLMRSSR